MKSKIVSMIGLGYIGLPTAVLISSKKYQVLGVDINENVVKTINSGNSHIVEPGVETLLKDSLKSGLFKAFTSPQKADIYIIAVPTPFKENKQPDISYVIKAVKSISSFLKKGDLILLESTSPVGTIKNIADLLRSDRPDFKIPGQGEEGDIYLSYCPERIIPGFALKELVENDRVIGGICPHSTKKAIEFYETLVKGKCLPTNDKTAEMVKLTENSFRDVNIAFANELSILCDKMGINVWELIKLANHHPRVNILNPGAGVGGHCIAVDPWFIVSSYPEYSNIIRMARNVNDGKPKYIVRKTLEELEKNNQTTLSVFGLAFKPDIDDLRESPSLGILEDLAQSPLITQIYVSEPYIETLPPQFKTFPKIKLVSTPEAISRSSVLVMLVAHKQFKTVFHQEINEKIILDFQGIWTK